MASRRSARFSLRFQRSPLKLVTLPTSCVSLRDAMKGEGGADLTPGHAMRSSTKLSANVFACGGPTPTARTQAIGSR